MRLKSIHIENFFSIKDVSITFPTGIISVIGSNRDVSGASSNGSGKSTLFDAISWVLFGKTLRPIGTDDVIRRGADQCSVELLVEVGTTEYFIIRTRGKKTNLQVWDAHQSVEMTKATTQATQATLDEIIGMDYKTFLSVATFDLDVLRFARATDKEQKEILERLLDLDLYNKGLEKVRKEITEKERTLQTIADNKQWIEKQLEQETQNLKKINAEQQNYQYKLAGMELATANGNKTRQDEITLLQGRVSVNTITIKNIQSEILKPEPVDQQYVKDLNTATVKVMTLQNDIKNLTFRISETEKELVRAQKRMGEPCGECGRPITENEIGNVIESIAQTEVELIEEKVVKESELQNALHDKMVASTLFEQRETLRKQAAQTQNEKLSHIGKLNDENYKNNEKISSLQKEISEANNTLNVFRGSGDILSSRIADTLGRIEKATNEIQQKEKSATIITEEIGFLKFWEKGFGYSGIRSVLLDEVAVTITKKANEYLKHLMGGSLWIDCHTQTTNKDGEKKEKFEVQTFNSFGAGTYFGNSKGEQQRIDIALSLALHDIARQRSNRPLGFCIMDEIFERLDSVGCDSIVSLLHKERSTMGTVFVVSHHPDIIDRFPTHIEFIKQGGITRLAGEEPKVVEEVIKKKRGKSAKATV